MREMKFLKIISVSFCLLLLVSSQLLTGVQRALANDVAKNAEAVTGVTLSDGIVSWIPTGSFDMSSFVRVDRTLPNSIPAQNSDLNLLTVRNGQASAQLAITSEAALQDVQVEVSDLQATFGDAVIPQAQVNVYYPSFVPNEGTGGGVIADPLVKADKIDIPAREVQPVWFNFMIPKDAKPGKYKAKISITANGKESVTHDMTIEVADVTLPNPEDFNFHLNLWMQPDAVAVAHDVEPWSNEHWDLLKPYIKDVASRGQKVINAVLADDPWQIRQSDGSYRSQTYTPYGNLVDWSYDGESWSFDYEHFDKYVELSLQEGMGPYIHAFGMVMFGKDHLKYTDTRTGETVDEVVQLGGPLWKDAWSSFLPDFEQHLRDKGWFEHTLLAFDERPQATMKIAFDFLDEVAPVFKNKLAVAADSNGLEPYSAEISFNYSATGIAAKDIIDKRRADGKITTFYTYYQPHHPNTNTISPLIGSRTLPWISAQHNLDGYLRWTYNSWPADVFNKPSFQYTQGDEYIVYPGENGPISSLRWEQFRNGVEDFELIKQLREQAGSENAVLKKALKMVNADAAPSNEVFANVLQARKMIIDELIRFRDVSVSLTPEQPFGKAGDVVKLDAVIQNTGADSLTDVKLNLNVPAGWSVKALGSNQIDAIKPNGTFNTAFEVGIPDSEHVGRFAQLEGLVTFERNHNKVELPLSTVIEILDLRVIPQSQMTATATSEEAGTDLAAHAIDGNLDTMWHTTWSGKDTLPQSITLDLGDTYLIDEFTYLPRQGGINGVITQYKLYTSSDGVNFTEVAQGNWANNKTEKSVQFPGVAASHVKLEAIQGVGGYASAAELNVFQLIKPKTTSISAMKALVEQFEVEGEFDSEKTARSLKTHLTAVAQYEKQGAADKVVKHMKSFKVLLDYQKERQSISDKAYNALQENADVMIKNWE
ncbi:glycoside hydrolase domain-containing protein [Sporosarcina sp. NPDC096371]|uniref:glycoside hydrolase domain-containing protein n=1 Tax=Sporosarcina sp. NPDC096371 TaxID=3364530 RepID=UPI00381C6CD7